MLTARTVPWGVCFHAEELMRFTRRWLLLVLIVDAVIAALAAMLKNAPVGMLIAGPLLASLRLSAARTAAIGCVSVALGGAAGVPDGTFGTTDHLLRMLVIVLGGTFAVLFARMRGERDTALTRMTQVAEVAQRALLHPIPATIGGVAFAVHYQSATHGALVGGDFYDTALTPHGLRLIVGDVKGKGLEAVQLAAAVLGRFREVAFIEPDPVRLVKELDARISGELDTEDFVTLVLAEFIPGEVRLVNCGHHPPVRVGQQLDLLAPPAPAFPLGLGTDPVLQRVRLASNERLLFYTDGLVEARNAAGDFFMLDEQVKAALTEALLDDAIAGLLGLVLGHTGSTLGDDLVLVLGEPAYDRSPVGDPRVLMSGQRRAL
jgi:hypothetical protein